MSRKWWRKWFRFIVVIVTTLQALSQSRGLQTRHQRAQWLHEWCSTLLRRLHIHIEFTGTPPATGLVISNHLGYIDILVFSAIAPFIFVSKSEVKDWPLFGQMAIRSGTVFVVRSRKSDVSRVKDEIVEALHDDTAVMLFPEGTSSDGSSVLPFLPSLLEAAVAAKATIHTAHVRYSSSDGDVVQDVHWWGDMEFMPNLFRLLALDDVHADILFSEDTYRISDRKQAAIDLHQRMLQLHGRDK